MSPTRPTSRATADADTDLDLPPLDGATDVEGEAEDLDELEDFDDDLDALDDATAEDDPVELDLDESGASEASETGWLAGADEDASLDVGSFDMLLTEEDGDRSLDDAPDVSSSDDLLELSEELAPMDGGEEGPSDDDEELREEDLPALDADEEEEIAAEALFDESVMAAEEELRWADRAWARVLDLAEGDLSTDDSEDAEAHLDLDHDGDHPREAAWRRLEGTGRVTASTVVPGEAVVVAMNERSCAVLVRISADGLARIIAEVEADGDLDEVVVSSLRWDASNACLVATGSFGTQAFRPV